MIVVDTNIICCFWIESPLSRKVEALRERDANWLVPPLWRSEFRNALILSVRHQVLTRTDAMKVMERAEKLLKDGETPVSSRRVMELAAQTNSSAYDCEFVAVAQQHGIPMLTADRRVLREFPHTAISLGNFLAS